MNTPRELLKSCIRPQREAPGPEREAAYVTSPLPSLAWRADPKDARRPVRNPNASPALFRALMQRHDRVRNRALE